MTSSLRDAIKQSKPFAGPEHEAFLAIVRSASALSQQVTELLRPTGLSGAHYNILRILRGAGDGGLACGEIATRLLSRDPDMTRLLDRLERDGLVARARESADRRIVTTRITETGVELLATLDEPIADLHRRQLGHLGPEKVQRLLALLEDATPAGR